jgi:hypothetical protein
MRTNLWEARLSGRKSIMAKILKYAAGLWRAKEDF